MKKSVICFAIAAFIAGCADDTNESSACGHGTKNESGVCICDEGYKTNLAGICNVCLAGYTQNAKGECVKDGTGNTGNNGNSGNTGNNGNSGNTGNEDGKCYATFTYFNEYTNIASGGTADFDVYLVGEFNNWLDAVEGAITSPSKANYKMTSDGKGNHTIKIEVEKDDSYKYKYYVDGWDKDSWKTDPANGEKDNDDNSIAKITQCGISFGKSGTASGNTGGNTGGNAGGNTGGGTVVLGDNHIKSIVVNGKNVTITLSDGVNITSVTGGKNAQYTGSVVTDTVDKNTRYNYDIKTDKGDVYAPVWVEDTAFDWRDALLYFAFTDRFVDGDSSNNTPTTDASHEGTSDARWMGGDFKGLKQKVEEGYFTNMGVNTLWISSVSMNTQGTSKGTDNRTYSAYHSYWPITTFMTDANKDTDFKGMKAIEPHFGTMEELRALVDACHERGMRVLVDFAANHVHRDSPIYKNHQNWFNDAPNGVLCDKDNNWDNYPEKCWFSADLPDINYEIADARQLMVDHAIWLIKQTGIDGFRVDAVKHMNIQFIKDLRSAVETLFNNTGITFYMVGETFTGDVGLINKYIGNDLLHAQFDFPLYYSIQDVLRSGNMGKVIYDKTSLNNSPYPTHLMGTFMGNHDVARALSVAAGQSKDKWKQNPEVPDSDWKSYFKVKQAMTILLTQPGVPLIYYGDEYGMEGANDPDNRRMMEFGDALNNEQKGALKYVQKLGTIRAQHPAIRRGTRKNIDQPNDQLWCYEMNDGTETIIVGIAGPEGGGDCNLGSEKTLVNLLADEPAEIKTSTLHVGDAERFQIYLVK